MTAQSVWLTIAATVAFCIPGATYLGYRLRQKITGSPISIVPTSPHQGGYKHNAEAATHDQTAETGDVAHPRRGVAEEGADDA